MKISKPEKAIGAFEQALRKNPADAALASRVGKVLVTTHEYVKAIEYYSTAFQKDASKQVRAGAPRTRRRVGGWGHHARVRARRHRCCATSSPSCTASSRSTTRRRPNSRSCSPGSEPARGLLRGHSELYLLLGHGQLLLLVQSENSSL